MSTTTLSNKLIAVLLSFALVFSFTPSIAFAENEANSQTTAEEAGSDENNTNENTADSSPVDGTNPSDSSASSQNNSTSSSSTSVSGSDEQVNSNARTASNDNNQTSIEASDTEANDQANSWRYIDGEQIYSYEGASTEAVDPNTPMPFAAAPDAFSYATWYKSNGTSSYTYKETPSSSGQNISVSGVKRVGIDVSYHNGTIDWAKVKNSGVSFAIIRCGYGSDFRNQDDTQFINNVRGAQANGIDIGIYLYSYAMNTTGNDSSATSEAEHVLRLLNEAGLEPSDLAYPIFYDLEESKQLALGSKKLGELATTFCNVISNAGYEVGIYSNLNWWTNYLTDSAFDNSSWHKWAARYPGQNKATDSGVSGTEIWQFSDCGNVDGINGNCDMNFDYVDLGSKWVQVDGLWYYQKGGEYLIGWQKIKNDWYYLDPEDGHMWTGWQTIDGKMYYLTPGDNGSAKTGWQKIDNQWYYFDSKPSCAMLTGWQKIKNDWYYLDPEDGHMWTGLQQIENKWYYLTPGDNGSAKTGWQEIDGKWYYFSAKPSCAALTGWQTIDGKRYYFDPDNAYMYVGRQEIGGEEYLFDSEGRAFIDTWVDWEGERIYADEMGRLLYIWVSDSESGGVFITDLESNKLFGWIICGNKRYYADQKTGLLLSQSSILDGQWYEFNEDYTLKTGWTKRSDDYWYFLGDDGLPETGWVKVDGYWYYLDLSDGHMLTGWQKIDGYWHYLKPGDSGRMLTGWQWIDGHWYYFMTGDSGRMLTGWQWIDGHWYYFMTGDSGRMLTGWQWIDGQWYYFSSSGALIEGGDMAIKAQGYSSGTNYLILVDCSSHKVGVFHGSQNNWSLQYSWSCVTGAPATPTIKGTFHTTGFKRGSLSTDSRAIWCTQISGGYFFHSILASESELGNSLSHGCIRLPYTAAQWIYNNIYAGTTVVIYE